MELDVEYLSKRHRYWVERISSAGIWESERFRPVEIIVRAHSHSYNALFHRKWVDTDSGRRLVDYIILYQQYSDLSVQEIDDTLVHEMIHQYIYQNDIHDTSTHGKIFKEYMRQINATFPEELNLTITKEYPHITGPGNTLNKLILLRFGNDRCLCCKIRPTKVDAFIRLIEQNKLIWNVKDYLLCESYDRYFDSLPACTRRLHGEAMSLIRLKSLCKECDIKRIKSIS